MGSYDSPSAGSLYAYETIEDLDYAAFDTTQPTWGYTQEQSNIINNHEQGPIESLGHYATPWPRTSIAHQPFISSQHLSASSFSSTLSSYRSSGNSNFSQTPLRDSMSSSISGYSHTSDMSRNQHLSLAEHLLCHGPTRTTAHVASPIEEPHSRPLKGKISNKPAVQEKDYFKTCVSASKQSRYCSKEYKYFCTSCQRPLVDKSGWKRHEETYQERPEMFACDLCHHIYFLEKDFIHHHAKSHRCKSCGETTRSKKVHALSAKRKRITRTGWGCGFCCHFSSDWTERCDHVAGHMEEGLTKRDWYHTNVILSLLQRPAILPEWMRLLRVQPPITGRGWNQSSTGRVEGYPESNLFPRLQDCLEFFTPDQDAAALVQLAYSKLSAPPTPPPVPPKDYPHVSMRNWDVETYSWEQLTDSVIEDDVLPTGISRMNDWYAGS